MLKLLKNLFETTDQDIKDEKNQDLYLLCGLMIEAANTDGKIDNTEIKKIKSILEVSFKENPIEIENSLKKALDNYDNDKSLHYYTSKINKNFNDQQKLLLIETLWEIVLSDGKVHDFESNLIRRLSGLLYISDVNSGNARKRALNKILEQQ